MKRNILKKVVIFMFVFIQLLIISNIVFASTTSTTIPIKGQTQPLSTQQTEQTLTSNDKVTENVISMADSSIDVNSKAARTIIGISKTLLEILQLVGISVGLIMLVVIGIKFILKSDKEKPDFRGVAMNYIFGAICIFGATTILTFIQKIAIQFKNAV